MNREDFIKFIPIPDNKDIILYDISLENLIDIDVFKEYNKLYPIFVDKKNKYMELKAKVEEYQNAINKIYLANPTWTEADYLQNLQNDKKTYSTLFGEIKKIENNIDMLQRNLKVINEKIQMQTSRDNKKINEKKDNIDKDFERDKEKMLNYKNYLDLYNLSLRQIEEQINDNEEEFQLLAKMQSKLEEGKCKCEFCGRMIKTVDEDSLFYKRMVDNIEKNKNKLEELLVKKEKVQKDIGYYESELKKIKDNLQNYIQFKKENDNFYAKKTVEVLKLEATRDEMINNISKLKKQLENDSRVKTKQYINLKSNIEKYELSLSNLKKIKDMKAESKINIDEFNTLKQELKDILKTIEEYIKFITIYYKVIEKKASEFCGPDYNFKFAKLEDYKIIPILEIFYQGVEYTQLDKTLQDEVSKYLIKKFSIYL